MEEIQGDYYYCLG